jgi:hypothetical protein
MKLRWMVLPILSVSCLFPMACKKRSASSGGSQQAANAPVISSSVDSLVLSSTYIPEITYAGTPVTFVMQPSGVTASYSILVVENASWPLPPKGLTSSWSQNYEWFYKNLLEAALDQYNTGLSTPVLLNGITDPNGSALYTEWTTRFPALFSFVENLVAYNLSLGGSSVFAMTTNSTGGGTLTLPNGTSTINYLSPIDWSSLDLKEEDQSMVETYLLACPASYEKFIASFPISDASLATFVQAVCIPGTSFATVLESTLLSQISSGTNSITATSTQSTP